MPVFANEGIAATFNEIRDADEGSFISFLYCMLGAILGYLRKIGFSST